jgi:hypothetical protein
LDFFYVILVHIVAVLSGEVFIDISNAEEIFEPVFRLFVHDADVNQVVHNAAEVIGGVDAPTVEYAARELAELCMCKKQKAG